MTRISFELRDLNRLIGTELSEEDVLRYLPMIGSDVDGIFDGEVRVEFFPDRPDLYSVEGVARALSAYLQIKPGLRQYSAEESDVVLNVDESVLDVRPVMLSGIIEGIEVDDDLIRSMMQLQEKLHLTLGRKRKKVSIGLHDLDKVRPPFTYKAVVPTEVEFEPLQMEGEYMNLDEILRRHPKGQEYAHILKGFDMYPLFVDADSQVLSFPPIINASITTVTEDTRNILMDVTGMDARACSAALNIIMTALADRGGKLRTVRIKIPSRGREFYAPLNPVAYENGYSLETPVLKPESIEVDVEYVNRIIGVDLSDSDIINSLDRMGLASRIEDGRIHVKYPPYRIDILHPIDIVEDIAIGYGYENIPLNLPQDPTFGNFHRATVIYDTLSRLMTGMGFLEVKTLTLSNPSNEYVKMSLPEDDRALVLKNPLSEMHTIAKTRTLASLMNLFSINKHRDLPQRIFEITDVIINGANHPRLGFGVADPKASYTMAKSIFETLLSSLGVDAASIEYREDGYYDGLFIPGRHAQAIVYDENIGYFGEVHPEVLERFELGTEVILGELFIDKLDSVL